MSADFGLDGKRVNQKLGGFAKELYSYDNRGDVTEEAFFAADGAPGRSDGCATIKYTYDDFGRQTGAAYFDAAGRVLTVKRGAQMLSFTVVSGQLGTRLELIRADGKQAAKVSQPAPPISTAPGH